jgi:hypothetical protein
MTGTWKGYYKYDNKILQKASGFDKTFFTIIVKSSDESSFEGNVIDDINTGGMQGTGDIIGKIDGEKITFKKLMPRKSTIDLKGQKNDSDGIHPTIYYSGIFSENRREINGEWKFKITIGFLFGFIPIPYRPGKGTWSMALQ